MVLIRGLDRLPNTAQENLNDADWAVHAHFLQLEYEAEGRRRDAGGLPQTSFQEFATPFADRPFNRDLHEQVIALRKQADALRRIAKSAPHTLTESVEGEEEEDDDPSLVSNIEDMTFHAGPLDAGASKKGLRSWSWKLGGRSIITALGLLSVLVAGLLSQ